jgi:hypothetical protein
MAKAKSNWYKVAMPKLDESGPDGSVFGSPTNAPQDAPYAPNKADFVEAPFEWLKPVNDGELEKRMNVILKSLTVRFPHLPQAAIAHSVNNGVTMYLNAHCYNKEFSENAGFDCSDVLLNSPSHDQTVNSSFEPDEVAKIVYEKLDGYFKYN